MATSTVARWPSTQEAHTADDTGFVDVRLASNERPQARSDAGRLALEAALADVADPLALDPLAPQVLLARGLAHQQQVAEGVRHQPVDLLRHPAVERAEPRLDVGHRDPELHRGERAGHRRVHVADHHHGGGTGRGREQVLLVGGQDPRRLLPVRPGAHAQRHLGLSDPQIAEEDARHPLVVVLPGVDEARRERRPVRAHRPQDGRHLHEVGPGPDDVQDVHLGRLCKIRSGGPSQATTTPISAPSHHL
jgi:hypothetical protein